MSQSLLYSEDYFVVLETNQPEEILTAEELFLKLKGILADRQDNLPQDLQKIQSLDDRVQHLLATSCEFDLEPGQYLQWYAVRLEK
jgi:REP element-mobilizing transposase RayT